MNFGKKLLEIKVLCDSVCDYSANHCIDIGDKILFLVGEFGCVSPALLISKIHIAKSNLAFVCSNLISRGLLSSTKDASDRRLVHYRLTEKGKAKIEKISQNIEKMFRADELTKQSFESLSAVADLLNKKV